MAVSIKVTATFYLEVIFMVEKLNESVFYVGANHPERRLFDELIPLPDGTSYNSYLIKGSKKTALIDTVDPEKSEILVNKLEKLGIDKIDFVIANHAEQDHSGSIPVILDKFPEAKVATNTKCKSMLEDLLLIDSNKFQVVGDGDTISLGDKTLKFIIAPWVHWPETQFTYLVEDKILFTCDFLGSHYASEELFVEDKVKTLETAKRYFAEIMMPFSNMIKKDLKKIDGLDIKIIAPSHGLLYKDYDFIVDAYKDWISENNKNEVIIPYVSMHGSTKKMVDYLSEKLKSEGIAVKLFNLTGVDLGELAMSLVDAATVVLATSTVLAGPHPSAVYAAYLLKALRPKIRNISLIGSYGWGGKTEEIISSLTSTLKVDLIDPVIIKGYPKGKDFSLLDTLVERIAKKHEEFS